LSYIVKRSASSVERFRDGQPVLAGFVLSDKPVAEDRWLVFLMICGITEFTLPSSRFPLPDIPEGWKPDPRRVWDKDKENLKNAEISSQPTAHGKRNTGISADQVIRVLFLDDERTNRIVARGHSGRNPITFGASFGVRVYVTERSRTPEEYRFWWHSAFTRTSKPSNTSTSTRHPHYSSYGTSHCSRRSSGVSTLHG
jgi:hypothetical protein